MYYLKTSIKKIFIVFMFVLLISALTGCNEGPGILDGEFFTVVYDGNGGFLGNKTSTVRKLQVVEGSKLPKYLQDYAQDSYVVSSLGLATRQGYTLKGWYLESNAEYAENPVGAYVYLDLEDGNGVYKINEQGQYVYGYVIDPNGALVFINVEPLADDADPETTEYIYFNGSNGYGFYVYDSEDPTHVEVYNLDGGYSVSEVTKYGKSYLVFDELTASEKELFADVPKYVQAFYEYTEADEGLTRYSLESGYIYFDTMMVLDSEGLYVYDGTDYLLYDSENVAHQALERFSVDARYIFTSSTEYVTPSDLTRYNADIIYWDFENDRVTENITLIAHWERKLTVNYIQKSGQVTVITKKLNEDNTDSIDLVAGETIGKLETIPLFSGYTFVAWSKSETEFDPWDFDNDVFPTDKTELNLYAYMIEGEYTRITSQSGLAKVALNPNGNYLLVNNIDLNGTNYNNSTPLGFVLKTSVNSTVIPFTGKFISMGYKISNFTLTVQNQQKTLLADAGVVVVSGLFPFVQNATISGLVIENANVVLSTGSTATTVVCDIGSAALIGTALVGNTVVSNVDVDVVFSASTGNVIDYPVYVGDIVARGEEYVTITNSTSTIDYSSISGITTDTLYVSVLQ